MTDPKVQLVIEVTCSNRAMADKVRTEFFPSLDELLHTDGVEAVNAVYRVERSD